MPQSQETCGVYSEAVGGFTCTRPLGHAGSHMANDGFSLVAIWDDDLHYSTSEDRWLEPRAVTEIQWVPAE
jgi:hypothetical protein